MTISPEGKFEITPAELYARAQSEPERLINDVLIRGTPHAFATYRQYCDFLAAAGGALRVHPASLFVRGSCKIGFSVSPRIERPPRISKLWRAMTPGSDIDLAIVDADFYYHLDNELQRWEADNNAHQFAGDEYLEYVDRQRDRSFYFCREYSLPQVVCVSFRDAIQRIKTEDFCDHKRPLSAFVFRDWWSLRRRYEKDLRQLCDRVATGKLPEPPNIAAPAAEGPPPDARA
jgi:hypothetical protein